MDGDNFGIGCVLWVCNANAKRCAERQHDDNTTVGVLRAMEHVPTKYMYRYWRMFMCGDSSFVDKEHKRINDLSFHFCQPLLWLVWYIHILKAHDGRRCFPIRFCVACSQSWAFCSPQRRGEQIAHTFHATPKTMVMMINIRLLAVDNSK